MTKPLLQEGRLDERFLLDSLRERLFYNMLIAEFDSVFIDTVFLPRN